MASADDINSTLQNIARQISLQNSMLGSSGSSSLTFFNVAAAGGVADGVTDNATIINNLIASTSATNYNSGTVSALQFSAGIYIVNSPIVLLPNVVLKGLGIDITFIKAGVDNITVIAPSGLSQTGSGGIENMTVWGYGDRNGTQGSDKLVNIGPFDIYWIRQVKAIWSRNMSLTGTGGSGFVEDCVVYKSLRDGIDLTNTKYTVVANNDIQYTGDDAIAVHVTSGASSVNDYSTRIVGNRIEFSFGIKLLGARNSVVEGNTLRFFYGYGVQIGLDGGFNQGLITRFSVSIAGNTFVDGLNANEVGGGNVRSVIWLKGGESLGSGGDAIGQYVGQYNAGSQIIQTPDAFINKTGTTIPLGPTGNVSIVGNTIRQTISGITKFSDAGFGLAWNNTGFIDPVLTTLLGEMIGISLQDDCENITIQGNTMHGTQGGISSQGLLTNCVIDGNTIFRCINDNGISLINPASIVAVIHGSIAITNNLIDIDPYVEASRRTVPIDGSWTANDGANSIAIFLQNFVGITITGNRFRNCLRMVKNVNTTNYIVSNNTVEADWTSPVLGAGTAGIGNLSDIDASTNFFWFCNSNPASASFNQYDTNFYLSNTAMPASGTWFHGTFVRNLNPSIDVNSLVLSGWIRLTDSANNILGTDWANAYVKHTSP